MRTKSKQIKQIRDLQKETLKTNEDDYMIGFYNGIEVALAILENRKPVLEMCVKESEIKDKKEEQVGRTIKSGIICKR